ncbi:ABC transporter ATP-binding protein [Nocardia jinanensis]|uniref:ABC transporter n=1 Tax=Nocardia jinanensis TaxID=382504 RepID=A0A917VV58_9NOCA|nr:ABC transporter ATP-binding protein [Nocardia jinanensis]GGL23278.1 ABC transporter [Nocardia jinanensis]
MTVQAAPLTAVETGNRPPRAQQKAQKQREAQARKEILAPVNGALTAASLIVAVASVANVVPFVLIVEACRELLSDRADSDRVWVLLWSAVIVLIVRGVLQAVALTWSHHVDGGFQLAVRRSLADKLTRVPLGWFGERTSGDVKKYLQDDVEALHYLVAHARLDFVGGVVVPVVTLAYLCTVDWRLTLVLLIPLLAYGISLSRMMDRTSRDRLAVYNRWERRVQAATIEFVDGIQVVRAFGQAGRAHHEFQAAVDGQTTAFTRWKTPMIRLQAIADITVAPVFVMLVIVAAGLGAVGLDWAQPLDLLPFLLVGLGLGSSLLGLGYGGEALRAAGAAAVRLYDLQQTPELRSGAPEPAGEEVGGEPGLVRFEGVSFGYRDDHQVLRDIDLELRPGTLTALVGPSGSGKSTLAELLPRFYDVGAGRITIGGRDIRDFGSDELYRTVGFVFQDVRLIRGSIRDNLLLARPDSDDATLRTATRAAQIHDRITALPRGYDSEIGVDAILSGGEAQRLSIARALLADTPLLVLDEATAFADPESEAAVQDALARLVAGRTVLVIAHRLHTITGVDRILVLDNGVLVEQGTHEQLKTAGGTYQRLWEINEAAVGAVATADSGDIR